MGKIKKKLCKHDFENRIEGTTRIDTPLHGDKGRIILDNVPATICPKCGKAWVNPDILLHYMDMILREEIEHIHYCYNIAPPGKEQERIE